MQFLLIVVISLVVLGAIAALFSIGGKDEPIVTKEGDCASCTSRSECKLAELKEEGDRRKQKKIEGDRGQMTCGQHESAKKLLSFIFLCLLLSPFDTYEDHRMALAFAPAAMRFEGLLINNPQVVTKSYPQFWEDIKAAGFEVKSEE